jgi:hypothetical protein
VTATGTHKPQKLLVGLAASAVVLLIVWPFADMSLGGDHYFYLARSFARGTLDVDAMSDRYRDYVLWHGHKYLPFGPFPAVLLVPFLWLIDAGVHLVFFGYALTCVNVFLMWRALGRAGVDDDRRPWIVLLCFAGTPYLSVTLGGISTFFAQIVVTTMLLLAIHEALGSFRPFVAGLCIGFAAASRMTAAFTVIFFIWMIITAPESTRGLRVRRSLVLLAGLFIPLLLVAAYNAARFGNPLETGFGLALLYDPKLDAARSAGLFSLEHVPKNLEMALIRLPDVAVENGRLTWPWLRPSPWGMGIFFTSPALLYVFRASLRDRLVQASWLAVVCTGIPLVTYYGIGYVQFGYRYALDVMPFLVLIAARGIRRPTSAFRVLVAASVVINIWGAMWLSVWI